MAKLQGSLLDAGFAAREVVAAGQGVTHGKRTEPNYPWIFDIENDPKELWNISFTNGWVGTPVGRVIADYQ